MVYAFYAVVTAVVLLLLSRVTPRRVRVGPEQAILRDRHRREVFFDRAFVIPALDTHEIVNLSTQTVTVSLLGREGVHCRDNIRADVKATLQVRIPRDPESVLQVAQNLGCSGASDPLTLERLFLGKLTEALRVVLRQVDFEEGLSKRETVRDEVIKVLGCDLDGFQLQDLSLEYLEQTPLEALDPDNILDAAAIRKITELTAAQHIATNEIRKLARAEVEG